MTAANAVTAINAFRPAGDTEAELYVEVEKGHVRVVCGIARGDRLVLLLTRPLTAEDRQP